MWRDEERQLVLKIHEADFYLATPQMRDFTSWRYVRLQNRGYLQPFEPTWKNETFLRSSYRRYVRQAEYDLVTDGGVVLFLKSCADDQVIGGINLKNIRRGSADMGTLGYWMAQAFSGAGRMKKAVGRVTEFGFREYDLHRVEAACIPDNHASAAILLANGFEEEGFARAYLKINGAWHDHRLFARVRDEA